MHSFAEIINSIENKIRACASCGSLTGFNANSRILCLKCNRYLQQAETKGSLSRYDLKVFSIYEWGENNSSFISELARSLKGGGAADVYEEFAQQLIELRLKAGAFFGETVFVPAPGRINLSRTLDHAEMLAKILAESVGAKFERRLMRIGEGEQKRLNEVERRSGAKKLKSIEGYGQIDRNKRYVFVDDIITTGTTALGAYNALLNPTKFEIWTIFHRPRLR